MRKVLAFLVWVFSLWPWKDFFRRWLRSPASHSGSGESAEHLPSKDGQQQSEFARFLASPPKEGPGCDTVEFYGDSRVIINFGHLHFTLFHGTGVEVCYREFLEAVASSQIVFHEEVSIRLVGDDSCKHLKTFADELRQSSTGFRKLRLFCENGSGVRFAKCVSSVLLGNDTIKELSLYLYFLEENMGKELAMEFMANIALPYSLRILKSLTMLGLKLDEEGMEQFLKPFLGPPNVLEELVFNSSLSDVQIQHISCMLASSTSLKVLVVYHQNKKSWASGFSNMAAALCSNRSLQDLYCTISNSMELKVLLEPLMPGINNLQCNTTLTTLHFQGSLGGKEGIETLVDLILTNMSLLHLDLGGVDDLSLHGTQGIVNVLVVLEALKKNKSLKKIGLQRCKAVGGYKVLEAMMDLLLENHNIEDIDLELTGLEESGDADYVSSTLSKRKKMKLWDILQSMAMVNPTSGRVFLCGQPFAGKTRLRLSMKKLKEFQGKDETPNPSWIKGKMRNILKTSNAPKGQKEDMLLERTHGIEVESVVCDGIGITIWDMAGQTDYHSFHELVMPNLSVDGSSSMFLLMCNPMEQSTPSKRKSPSNIKLEIESWLRFIASNTRRSLSYCPHVSIIMTHLDYWRDDEALAKRIDDVVEELKSQFQEVLEFD